MSGRPRDEHPADGGHRGCRCGLIAGPALSYYGLAHLTGRKDRSWFVTVAAAAAGGVGAAAAVSAAHRTGSWFWLPALLIWAVTLSAAAVCDACTQRIPTPLLSAGAILVLTLIVPAAVVTGDWRGLAVTAVACTASGLILAGCWRFAGAGFGDVRLAAVGGLGLGHTSQRALVLALAVFIVLTVSQALWTLVRTRDRRATFAYGPALAVGFLVAAAS